MTNGANALINSVATAMYLIGFAFLLDNKAECMYEVFGAGAPLLTVLLLIIYDEQKVGWTG